MFTCLERGTETAQRDVPIPGYLRYSAGVQVAAAFTEGGKQSAQSPGRALEKHCHAWQTEFLQRPPRTPPLVARGVEQGSDTGQRNPGHAPPKGHFTPAGDSSLGRAPLCKEEEWRPEGRSQGCPGGLWNPNGALATPPWPSQP